MRYAADLKVLENIDNIKALYHAIPVGFVIQRADDMQIIEANDLACEILELSYNELLGRDSYDPRWYPIHEDGSKFKPETHPSMLTANDFKPRKDVIMGLAYDHGTRWISINTQPIFIPKTKEFIGVIATFVDITESKKLQREIELHLDEMKTLYQIANILQHEETDLPNILQSIISVFNNSFIHHSIKISIDNYQYSNTTDISTFIKEYEIKSNNITIGSLSFYENASPIEFSHLNESFYKNIVIDLENWLHRHTVYEALNEGIERLHIAFEGSQDGLIDWNLEDNSLYISPEFEQKLGYEKNQLEKSIDGWINLLHPLDQHTFLDEVDQLIKNSKQTTFEKRIRLLHASGKFIWYLMKGKLLHSFQGKNERLIWINSEITQQIEHETHLEFIAQHDQLTHLPNRTLLNELLEHSMARSRRENQSLAVLFLDLDGFKNINDTYGHHAGDKVLKSIANRLQDFLRDDDIIARIGGDEFIVVLNALKSEDEALPLIERVLNLCNEAISYEETSLNLSVSVGVSYYPQEEEVTGDTLLRQADQAMYESKTTGKNRFTFFDREQYKVILSQQEEHNALLYAIENDELDLYYQPQVDMLAKQIIGFEALLRWNTPNGILTPESFLPLIKHNSELLLKIGHWVFHEAFRQYNIWQAKGYHFELSINVSIEELFEQDFIAFINTLLLQYPNLNTTKIHLEILETSAFEDTFFMNDIISSCRDLGFSVSIDDFGTGYSTLNYLKDLNVNTIKIDKSFVLSMLHDRNSFKIIHAIIGLSHAFDFDVLAEGIETIEQSNILIELGCVKGQGFLIAKPLIGNQVLSWLDKWHPPYAWKFVKPIDKEQESIFIAKVDHEIWFHNLQAYLQDKQNTYPELNSSLCNMGIWLDDPNNRYKTVKEFEELEMIHSSIHSMAYEIIVLKESGNVERAIEELKDLYALHEQIKRKFEFLLELKDL